MLYCSAFKVFCFELYLLKYTYQVEQKKEFERTRVEIINPKLDFSDKKISRLDDKTRIQT